MENTKTPMTDPNLPSNKTCTKCGQTFEATTEFFYRNSSGKFGLTPRCKSCVNQDNKESAAKRDPEIIRKQATARSIKHYHKNLEKSRLKHREAAKKARQDPEKLLVIQSRKRGGGAKLTPEDIENIRTLQNNLCAICGSPDPTDLDHCHTTGKVRWLLCNHCNRGLGDFRDNPEWLEKAASLLKAVKI